MLRFSVVARETRTLANKIAKGPKRLILFSAFVNIQPPFSRNLRARFDKSLSLFFLIGVAAVALGASCGPVNSQTSWPASQQTRERRVTANSSRPEDANDGTVSKEMRNTNVEKTDSAASSAFYTELRRALEQRKLRLENVCDINDPVSRRVLEDYGAMFLADSSVLPPPVCMFTSEAQVLAYQTTVQPTAAVIGGTRIELQPAAMSALQAAREEARASGLDITPRGGSEAARRDYDDTVRLWDTRFLPALRHWSKLGRLTKDQAEHLRSLPLRDQVREVLELEKRGIYFSKDLSKSILYSIAAPGTSQHMALLALDVEQYTDQRVRRILARHGWFQTVKSDLPHFTYLGLEEKDLPGRGLRSMVAGNQLFWIPNVSGE